MGGLIGSAIRKATIFITEKGAKWGPNMTDFLGTTSVDDMLRLGIDIIKEVIKP